MTTTTLQFGRTAPQIEQTKRPHHVLLLRLEGAAAVVAGLTGYFALSDSWWLLATAVLAPDLSMIGYAFGPKTGARLYNLVHTYAAPALLAALGLLIAPWLLSLACIWVVHIGFDRALGYGLKLESGFRDTHLGRIGAKQTP
jgi:hypothetical protein